MMNEQSGDPQDEELLSDGQGHDEAHNDLPLGLKGKFLSRQVRHLERKTREKPRGYGKNKKIPWAVFFQTDPSL
jgi:hypothetical protein